MSGVNGAASAERKYGRNDLIPNSALVFTWTLAGQLQEADTWLFDGSGNLVNRTVTYTYDDSGTGLLKSRKVDGVEQNRFYWDGLNLSLDTGSTDRAFFNHPWTMGGTIAQINLGGDGDVDSSDPAYFYLHDEAGNVLLTTDKNGDLVDRFEQDVWGQDINNTFGAATDIDLHQTGKYLDPITGLYYFGARWYHPGLGRFFSQSPIAPFAEEEYVFAHNAPTRYVDLDGNVAVLTFIAGAWAVVEFGATIYDIYDAIRTFNDPCAGLLDRSLSLGGVALGAITPGGGYGAGSKAVKGIVSKSLDDLSQSGRLIDPADRSGQLTRAGRGLQKHGNRPGSVFSKPKGSPQQINQQGQDVLDDILTSPGSKVRQGNRFDGFDIIAPDDRGARFDSEGVFRGFLDP